MQKLYPELKVETKEFAAKYYDTLEK